MTIGPHLVTLDYMIECLGEHLLGTSNYNMDRKFVLGSISFIVSDFDV